MSPTSPGDASPNDSLALWLQQLTDPDRRMQQRAAYELCRLRDPRMIPTLITLLERKESLIAYHAVLVLSQLGEAAALPILMLFENSVDYRLRWSALTILGQLRARAAVIPLLKTLKLTDSTDRTYIPRILGQIGDPRAFEPLVATLQDGQSLVAKSAAIGLGLLGDARGRAPLLTALRTGDSAIRAGAAEGLGGLGDRAAAEALIEALRDRSSTVRFEAVLALGKVGDTRAVDTLWQLAQTDQAQTEEGESLADAATVVIGVLGGDWQHDALIRIVQTSQDWRLDEWATRGLGQLADPESIDLLMSLLQSVNTYQRLHAAVALGQAGAQRALDLLEEVAATDTGMLIDGRTVATAAAEAAVHIRQQHQP